MTREPPPGWLDDLKNFQEKARLELIKLIRTKGWGAIADEIEVSSDWIGKAMDTDDARLARKDAIYGYEKAAYDDSEPMPLDTPPAWAIRELKTQKRLPATWKPEELCMDDWKQVRGKFLFGGIGNWKSYLVEDCTKAQADSIRKVLRRRTLWLLGAGTPYPDCSHYYPRDWASQTRHYLHTAHLQAIRA